MKKIIKKFGVEGKKPYVVLIKEYDVTGCYEPDIDDVDQFDVVYIIKWDGREIYKTVDKRMAKRVFRQVKKFCKSVERMLYGI